MHDRAPYLPPYSDFLAWVERAVALDRVFTLTGNRSLQCGVACFLTEANGGRQVGVSAFSAYWQEQLADPENVDADDIPLPHEYAEAVARFDWVSSDDYKTEVRAVSWRQQLIPIHQQEQ